MRGAVVSGWWLKGVVNVGRRGPLCRLTAVCDAAHGDDSESLERYGYRVHVEAARGVRDYEKDRG